VQRRLGLHLRRVRLPRFEQFREPRNSRGDIWDHPHAVLKSELREDSDHYAVLVCYSSPVVRSSRRAEERPYEPDLRGLSLHASVASTWIRGAQVVAKSTRQRHGDVRRRPISVNSLQPIYTTGAFVRPNPVKWSSANGCFLPLQLRHLLTKFTPWSSMLKPVQVTIAWVRRWRDCAKVCPCGPRVGS
jgi:hypothetical protein